jgi:hypothetical protein
MTELRRLVLDFRTGELVVRCLYRTEGGPNPNTKARRKQVTDLTRDGLEQALKALDVGPSRAPDLVGTSGFMTREDVLLSATSPNAQQLVKGAVHK